MLVAGKWGTHEDACWGGTGFRDRGSEEHSGVPIWGRMGLWARGAGLHWLCLPEMWFGSSGGQGEDWGVPI